MTDPQPPGWATKPHPVASQLLQRVWARHPAAAGTVLGMSWSLSWQRRQWRTGRGTSRLVCSMAGPGFSPCSASMNFDCGQRTMYPHLPTMTTTLQAGTEERKTIKKNRVRDSGGARPRRPKCFQPTPGQKKLAEPRAGGLDVPCDHSRGTWAVGTAAGSASKRIAMTYSQGGAWRRHRAPTGPR